MIRPRVLSVLSVTVFVAAKIAAVHHGPGRVVEIDIDAARAGFSNSYIKISAVLVVDAGVISEFRKAEVDL